MNCLPFPLLALIDRWTAPSLGIQPIRFRARWSFLWVQYVYCIQVLLTLQPLKWRSFFPLLCFSLIIYWYLLFSKLKRLPSVWLKLYSSSPTNRSSNAVRCEFSVLSYLYNWGIRSNGGDVQCSTPAAGAAPVRLALVRRYTSVTQSDATRDVCLLLYRDQCSHLTDPRSVTCMRV